MTAIPAHPRRLGAKLLLAVLSTAAALLAVEIVFRALDLRGWHEPRTREWGATLVEEKELLPGVHLQFKPHSSFEFDYDSDPGGYFNERHGLVYEMNRWGLRGGDFDEAKPPGTRRIVVLGDSFTFGEGVKLEDTFCRRLEELLNHSPDSGEPRVEEGGEPLLEEPNRMKNAGPSRPGPRERPRIEVLNCGTSAWGTADEIHWFEQRGVRFGPDLTIVVYVLNDAEYAGQLDVWEEFRVQYEKRWLRHSYLASYLYASIGRRIYGRRYIEKLVRNAVEERGEWRRSFELLSEGRQRAEASGSRFAVVLFPFMYDFSDENPMLPIHRLLASYCTRNGIEFHDLFDAFKGMRDRDLWVHPSDQHPNVRAHRIAAEAIARFIGERRLLDSGRP